MGEREKIVEAMARAMFDCYHGYNAETQRKLYLHEKSLLERKANRALTAIAEQGYAIVPREATEGMAEAGAAGMYGKHWNGPADKAPGDNMREVWRRYSRAAMTPAIAATDIVCPKPDEAT